MLLPYVLIIIEEGAFFLAEIKRAAFQLGFSHQGRERVEGHHHAASPGFGSR